MEKNTEKSEGSNKRKIQEGYESRSHLVNALTPQEASELYALELSKWSEKSKDTNCIFSTRRCDIGCYAVMTIPKKYLGGDFANRKSQFRRVNICYHYITNFVSVT